MRPKLLAETILSFFNLKEAIYIKGPPGIGKTEIPRQVQRPTVLALCTSTAP
jgi:MoxR-like ATPase